MTEIRGQYLYNLQTGQTVGKNREQTEDDGGEYNKQISWLTAERYGHSDSKGFVFLK